MHESFNKDKIFKFTSSIGGSEGIQSKLPMTIRDNEKPSGLIVFLALSGGLLVNSRLSSTIFAFRAGRPSGHRAGPEPSLSEDSSFQEGTDHMCTLSCARDPDIPGIPQALCQGCGDTGLLSQQDKEAHVSRWSPGHATRRFCRNSEPLRTEPERTCRLLSRWSLGCRDPHRPVTERSHHACWVLPRRVRRDMPGQNPRPATEPALSRNPVSCCHTGMACQAPYVCRVVVCVMACLWRGARKHVDVCDIIYM